MCGLSAPTRGSNLPNLLPSLLSQELGPREHSPVTPWHAILHLGVGFRGSPARNTKTCITGTPRKVVEVLRCEGRAATQIQEAVQGPHKGAAGLRGQSCEAPPTSRKLRSRGQGGSQAACRGEGRGWLGQRHHLQSVQRARACLWPAAVSLRATGESCPSAGMRHRGRLPGVSVMGCLSSKPSPLPVQTTAPGPREPLGSLGTLGAWEPCGPAVNAHPPLLWAAAVPWSQEPAHPGSSQGGRGFTSTWEEERSQRGFRVITEAGGALRVTEGPELEEGAGNRRRVRPLSPEFIPECSLRETKGQGEQSRMPQAKRQKEYGMHPIPQTLWLCSDLHSFSQAVPYPGRFWEVLPPPFQQAG